MCQQGGEFWEKWSNKGEICLIFEKNLLCTGLWECIILGELHLWEGKALLGECLLCFWLLVLVFLVFLQLPGWLRRALPLSLRSHVFGFWSIASSHCPCLRGSICAWVSDWSCLSELFVTCLSSSLSSCHFLFFTSLVTGGVLTMHSSRGRLRNEQYSLL